MAKRIQMRKNRFLAIQKIAEQKKAGLDAAHAPPPGPPGEGDHAPKQTVSVASQNCSTIPRGHDAPHAQPHGVTTPATRHNIVEACLQGWAVLYSTDIYRTQLIQGVFWTRQPTINIVRRRSAWLGKRIIQLFPFYKRSKRKLTVFCSSDITERLHYCTQSVKLGTNMHGSYKPDIQQRDIKANNL